MIDATDQHEHRRKPGRAAAVPALLALALLAGCSTQVTYVRTRGPLRHDRIRDVKVVAVLPFRNASRDRGAAGVVESAVLAGIKDHFKAFGRKYVRQLVEERRFNQSDLVDPATRQTIRLSGADTAICGEVMQYSHDTRQGYEVVDVPVRERVVTRDKRGRKRVRYVTRFVPRRRPFLRVTAAVSIAIHMVRLSDGATLVSHAQTLAAAEQGGGASGRGTYNVPAGPEILGRLTTQVVDGFLAKVIETRVIERRTLDKYFGDAAKAAENGDWDLASRLFWALYQRNPDSAGLNNDVAVCIEATAKNDPAKLRQAVRLYEKALELDYETMYSRNLRRARAVLQDVLRHQDDEE
jgi:hypothetical protein